MDFKRIEWIFFLVFLGVNIFLFSIYREGLQDESYVSYSEKTESLETRLKKDQITHKKELSTKRSEGYYLSGEQTNFYMAIQEQQAAKNDYSYLKNITVTENGVIDYPSNHYIDPDEVNETFSGFLRDEKSVLYGNEYTYLPQFSNLNGEFPELVAAQSYGGIPIHDDTAQITLSLEKSETDDLLRIVQYSQSHIGNLEELREKADLYSEQDAIETLYVNNKIPSNSTITFSKLAYSQIYKIREKNVYVPVWFIGISSNSTTLQVEQVNAMSNTIITSNAVIRVEKDN
ncbi:two-component system regulatory protein YycI [Enterococcus sp. BWB1-3]|uniref:two-component system regulatory protein YycI n=1 Tax=unclassified Enterococcus TaxID=2608891 RepID=UPI0019228F9A|nr:MULTISPECIES: two-component system regulatory protein YycI [unclassified Enterococcus]MBL1230113.1 two-component system regulatory protein YycI [Enterococcus sp. BWB1-3]MCB5950984.1 two-component system regulatory protein YycI [Enterococcus sp. BWT-B8]MCB5955186.1 two-component system regulatory protein YycI [Enterococcus sp. CWB-B31]